MAISRRITFDLSNVTAGTPEIISLDSEVIFKLVSVQISQVNASISGVVCKLVQSNDSENWVDITDEKNKTIEGTTTTTTDIIYLETDFIGAAQLGLSIDVAGVTTGDLEIYTNTRTTI